MGALKSYLLTKRFTLERAAHACGVSPDLLLRVDQGRQPLLMSIVRQLAAACSDSVGSVEVAAGRVVETADPTALNPYPPVLGDKW